MAQFAAAVDQDKTLLGKVAIVRFGTYTCINWLRFHTFARGRPVFNETIFMGTSSPGAELVIIHDPRYVGVCERTRRRDRWSGGCRLGRYVISRRRRRFTIGTS